MLQAVRRGAAADDRQTASRGSGCSIPPKLYAAVRKLYPESRPPFRARPFDVQLIGGLVLYEGKIAEMATGEGKTFVGAAGVLHARAGGVCTVTS